METAKQPMAEDNITFLARSFKPVHLTMTMMKAM